MSPAVWMEGPLAVRQISLRLSPMRPGSLIDLRHCAVCVLMGVKCKGAQACWNTDDASVAAGQVDSEVGVRTHDKSLVSGTARARSQQRIPGRRQVGAAAAP